MASIGSIKVDRDWLRLWAYRTVLQRIADQGAVPEWARDDSEPEPHEMAESVLRVLGDLGDES